MNLQRMQQPFQTADPEIIWHNASFLQYEQIRLYALDFRLYTLYLETSVMSKNVFWMSIKKKPYQKLFELGIGIHNYTVDFVATNR